MNPQTQRQPVFAESSNYTVVIYNDAGGNIEYVAEAPPGSLESDAVWRIMKLSYETVAGKTCFKRRQWASGNNKFDKIADSYVSYTYS